VDVDAGAVAKTIGDLRMTLAVKTLGLPAVALPGSASAPRSIPVSCRFSVRPKESSR